MMFAGRPTVQQRWLQTAQNTPTQNWGANLGSTVFGGAFGGPAFTNGGMGSIYGMGGMSRANGWGTGVGSPAASGLNTAMTTGGGWY